uniref:glutathione transferase n=1 Tax=Euplotes crassus TaxID=5936 RepID=A0A7S3KRU6_EUPCR|mmetsp:Transcript_38582/g.38101  ORF Transcript_38582/g.38101 Transcript_38582/m.38101 type:complete len:208 (+) Transcript_38582:2-625(+)
MKLTYFNLYGRAEPIRLMLNASKTEFEDERIKHTDWPDIKDDKERFPYGQMPVLQHNGKVYSQSMAIYKYVANISGYLPDDADSQYMIDEAAESIKDLLTETFKIAQKTSSEEKKEAITTLKPKIETTFEVWEKNLKSNTSKDHYLGDKDSLADFILTCFYADHVKSGPLSELFQEVVGSCATLKSYFESRADMHKDYFDSRPKAPY